MFIYIYKIFDFVFSFVRIKYNWIETWIKFKGNRVSFSSFRTAGSPYVMVSNKSIGMKIGKNFAMNNGIKNNPIGCAQPCTFFVDKNSLIEIGDNVGISQAAIISHCSIKIGNNVKIGGGVCIYTTDFHSLNAKIRASSEDQQFKVCKPVEIGDNVFIGAKSLILKGVKIGKNSIIGAGSVVTKSIPENQIWGGNPAKFIRTL